MSSDTTPRPDTETQLRSRIRLFLVLLLALLVATQLELPFRLAGLAFGVATVWVGVLVLIQLSRLAREGRKPRGQLAVSLLIGLTGVMLSLLMRDVVLYPLVSEHEACLAEAQTNAAERVCDDANLERSRDLIERLNPRRE